ncbi:MAG: glycosyltransferase family 2 protein [Planctomycetes bacterium]|nr:glycosyltransferase family 2 protein [Planctomycetota bacterium]MBI3836084.1 glycosyltransferase family 2 protein [Planctomycetota bacterium]
MTSIVDVLEQRAVDRSILPLLEFDSEDHEATLAELPIFSHSRMRNTRFGGVTIIIPCYNEQGAIISTLQRVLATTAEMGRPFEVLVVDDGSTDDSTAKLRIFGETRGVRVLQNEMNRGYGFSLKRAVADSQYETIVIVDADGTYPVEQIAELIREFDGVDMVVGARVKAKAKIPLARRPPKWFLRKLASYLAETEIPDLNSGLRVMKRSLIRKFMPLLPDGFSFTTTITLAMLTHGCQVRFVPIDYKSRIGKSSIRPVRDTLNFFGLVVRTVLYFRPLKVFVPASAAIFLAAILVALISKLAFGQVADVTSVTLAAASIQLLGTGLLADLIDKRSPSYT